VNLGKKPMEKKATKYSPTEKKAHGKKPIEKTRQRNKSPP